MNLMETEVLGHKFYYDSERISHADIFGPSVMVKIFDKDCYGLSHIEEQNPTVLDIGSHIGVFPRVIKHLFPSAQVYSLEPDKYNFQILRKNNAQLENVESMNLGVWNEDSFLEIRMSDTKSWRSTLNVNKVFFEDIKLDGDSFSFGSHKVECKSIDNLVSSLKIKKLALLGITIPGEITAKVLEGAHETLSTLRPQVSLNIYPNEKSQILEIFKSHNYFHKENSYSTMNIFKPS